MRERTASQDVSPPPTIAVLTSSFQSHANVSFWRIETDRSFAFSIKRLLSRAAAQKLTIL
jgi:hypothetical protein